MRRRTITALVCALFGVLAAAPGAGAFDPVSEAKNFSKTGERFLGDQANLDYQSQLHIQKLSGFAELADIVLRDPARSPISLCAEHYDGCAGDVRLQDWGGRYGLSWAVQFVTRNGASISGHVWAPLPKTGRIRKLPAVEITNGSVQAPEEVYWYAAQTLARHGYLVLTWDPQGQGRSDTLGSGADFLRGVPAQQTPNFVEGTEEALDFLTSTPSHPYEPRAVGGSNASAKAKQDARVKSGHANAFNPLWKLLDPSRIGIAGHSLGALAVSQVGPRDPRVKAIVAWDNLAAGTGKEAPSVPALGMSADYGLVPTPNFHDPDPQGKNAAFAAYRKAGVDAAELTIRGGTHYEFSYIPNPAFGGTLRGMDMVAWYTRAWMDKYVKGDRTADARLLSDRWRSDAPEAAADPSHDGNLFSFYYRSRIAIHRFAPRRRRHGRLVASTAPGRLITCDDVRKGCSHLVPKRFDRGPATYSYLDDRKGG